VITDDQDVFGLRPLERLLELVVDRPVDRFDRLLVSRSLVKHRVGLLKLEEAKVRCDPPTEVSEGRSSEFDRPLIALD